MIKKVTIKTGKRIYKEADDWVKEKEAMAPVIKMKQINLKVTEELHHKFNVACTLTGMTMTETLSAFMRQYVRQSEPL